MNTPTPTPTAETSLTIKWLHRSVPLLFIALMILLAWHELKTIDIHNVRSAIQNISGLNLLLLQGFSISAILVMSFYDWSAALIVNIRLPLLMLIRYSWIANTFNNLIGLSGLAGSGIRYLLLSREGIAGNTSAVYSGIILLSIPVGLAALTWPLLMHGQAMIAGLPLAPWLAYLALGGFALFLPVYVFILRSEELRKRFLPDSAMPGWQRILMMILVSMVDWMMAVAVAWQCTQAAGAMIPFVDFSVAFALAAILGMLSLVPGGLGVFDGTLLALLGGHSFSSVDKIVAGLVVYRLVYYLVPWLIGIYLGADLLSTADRWQSSRWVRYWQDSATAALLRLPLGVLATIGVRALAYLTFGAGVVLLVSAAFPTLADRLVVLNKVFPLAAVEASHLLSVTIAVLLIAVARGIANQIHSAYRITQILLICGAVFSLIKGFDYEEAVTLLVISGVLRLQRNKFYRQAAPFSSSRILYLLISMTIAMLGFTALGAWIHNDIPLNIDRLLLFAPTSEAPRFARSLLFATLVFMVFIAWSLFRSVRPTFIRMDPSQITEARAVLNSYGGSGFAHLVFLGDKHLFWSRQRKAFLQYASIRDRLIVLGDPCGSVEEFDSLIMDFREFADLHDLLPVFYEVAEQHAYRYHNAGFGLFKLGEMALVNLDEFSLQGKRGESLRHSYNRAVRNGMRFELWEQPFDAAAWEILRTLSDSWMKHLGTAEKSFSLGSYEETYLALAPVAVIKQGEKVVAFASIMPDYGSTQEFSIDLMRHLPDAPPGSMDFLFIELLQWGKAQGYHHFNLGMAPLAGVGTVRFARPEERLARLAFEYGNRFYNYKGLRSFKEKFRPQWRSYYLAYPVFTPLPSLLLDSAALIAGGYRRIFFKLG